MKFKIIAEDKKKGKIEIPISFNQLSSIFDAGNLVCPDCIENFELNKFKKDFFQVVRKLEYVIDIWSDGKCYQMIEGKRKLVKDKFYLVKKPEWKSTLRNQTIKTKEDRK